MLARAESIEGYQGGYHDQHTRCAVLKEHMGKWGHDNIIWRDRCLSQPCTVYVNGDR